MSIDLKAGRPTAASMNSRNSRQNSLSLENFARQLAGFSGGSILHSRYVSLHGWTKEIFYTEGVQFFMENIGGPLNYWFLKKVVNAVFSLPQHEPFFAIAVSVKESGAELVIHYSDDNGNDRLSVRRRIEHAGLKEGDWPFFLVDKVLMLPSEYTIRLTGASHDH